MRWLVPGGLALLVIAGGTWYALRQPQRTPAPSTQPTVVVPASAPAATLPTTREIALLPPATYLELARSLYPSITQQELLTVPLDLSEAAHIRLDDPVFVCGRGDLWITRADAPETSTVLSKSYDEQTHLVRERIEFVWWRDDGQGNWSAWIVAKTLTGYEWIGGNKSRLAMPTDEVLDWRRTILWGDDALVVPTNRGVAIVRIKPTPSVDAVTLLEPDAKPGPLNQPQLLTDGQGVLAWVPADADGRAIGTRVARHIDGKWTTLDAGEWPNNVVHVVPLVDGSVLRLIANGRKIDLSLLPLTATTVDEAAVEKLVEQLSEPDPRDRLTAYKELTRYGPAVWPILEKLRDEQPPEAQLRIGQLLRDRTAPSLGGMTPINGGLRVVARDRFGGVVLLADQGVTMADAAGKVQTVNPAWVAIRPGHAPELLPEPMVADLQPGRHTLDVYNNMWVVTDATNGPRQYIGRSLKRLLRDDERSFDTLVGIDARGRWVFSRSERATTTAPVTQSMAGRFLILDPTLPDPTPKLPGWTIANTRESGWTADNWPAVNVDGKYYRLKEKAWERLDAKKNSADQLIANLPATPTTASAAILTTADRTRYFDGTATLRKTSERGPDATFTLPTEARGVAPVHLVETVDKILLLMNTPGRIVRLKIAKDDPEKLAVDGTFTRKIPNGLIRRFWLDPAGRLCIAHDEGGMTVLFPTGAITPEIRKMMPVEELEEQDH